MKFKTLLASIALFAGAVSVSAQDYIYDNPDNKSYFGARVAVDISSAANGGANFSNQAGFSLGAVYHIPLYMNLYFEPGLSVFYDTFGTANWDHEMTTGSFDDNGNPVTIPFQVDGSLRNFGFRVPLLVGFHFDVTEDIQVSVYTGPQFNASVLAKYHQNPIHVPGYEEKAFSTSVFGTQGFKHFDVQWNFGVGVTYQCYYLGFNGAWGMSHMADGAVGNYITRDIRRNLFSITLGYNF